VRVWEKPLGEVLEGGIGTLPLAPLTAGAQESLPAVIRRMQERRDRELTSAEAAKSWVATYVLMGLRYPRELTAQLLQGVRAMKESVTYQAIIAEGEARSVHAMQKALLSLGQRQFGAPNASTRTALAAITDPVRLQEILERVLDVSNWAELLNPPVPRPNGKRKKKPRA
jgi:hypothetical protein